MCWSKLILQLTFYFALSAIFKTKENTFVFSYLQSAIHFVNVTIL